METTAGASGTNRRRAGGGGIASLDPRAERLCVAGLVVLAAAGAAVTKGSPSGVAAADLFMRAAFAAGIVWFCSVSRRWTWFVLAGGAGALGHGFASIAATVVALLLAFGAVFAPRRSRLIGGLVGLLSVQVLLRLPDRLPALATAALVAVVCAPFLCSGYRLHRRATRRRIRIAVELLVAAVLVFGTAFALSVVQARTSLDQGLTEARSGLKAARAGNQSESLRHFALASDAFNRSRQSVDAWWARPARLLPGIGIQANSVADVVRTGSDLAERARRTASVADYRRLRSSKGQIDLALLSSYQQPVDALANELDHGRSVLARTQSSWLLPPLADRIGGFRAEVARYGREARQASDTLNAAPDLLGAHGPRRYGLVFATPAEARELGGFAGNFGELSAVNGKLTLERTVRSTMLVPTSASGDPEPAPAPADDRLPTRYRYYEPFRYPGNVTGTQDFPTVARQFASVYQAYGGAPLDGVIYVDPYGLAGLLRLTGPVPVVGLDKPLTADNAADFLLREQYTIFSGQAERVDFLDNASRATFEQLTSRELPGPKTVADTLSPLVHQHRLLAYSFHTEDDKLLDRVGLTGGVPPLGADDYLSVTTANANPNKIDAYLQRSVAYDARYNPSTGGVDATATVTLHNTSPAGGLPDYTISNAAGLPFGTNHTFLSVYTGLSLNEARLDGQPTPAEPQVEEGRNRYGLFLSVPPGGTTVVQFELHGSIGPDHSAYRLTFLDQPGVNPDHLTVTASATGEKARTPRSSGPIGAPRASTADSSARVDGTVAGGVVHLEIPLVSKG